MSDETARRWRLVLGRYADGRLPADQVLGGQDSLLEETLGYLFDREYTQRGDRLAGRGSGGTLDPTALTAITWLARARELFPTSTVERLQAQAIERYGLTDLLADEDTARTLDPSPQLATALLSVRGTLDAQLEAGMRTVIARVVDEIVQRLRPRFAAARSGRRNRFRRSPHAVAQNLDWRRTIGANLRHYDTSSGTLVIDRPWFVSRTRRHVPWDVVLCVDQSGSMAASVLYSAVCASILAGLPGVTVRLVLFDTSVVDMSHLAADPVTLLMRAQLGGGTDIAGAMRYCETLVTAPARTVVVLVSDFEEGGSVSSLLRTVTRLRTAGVRLLGLAALDEDARPVYDARVAGLLADRGMEIAALTPDRFAEWLADVMP